MMIDWILKRCNDRYEGMDCAQCVDCLYGEYCPRDCEKCLDYIHTPTHAPEGAPDRKYDCVHMADFYTCKYACRYTSEIMYAIENCRNLMNLSEIKVLSFGCGPCTELYAIDALKRQGILNYEKIEYRGIDYSRNVWHWIHEDIKSFQTADEQYKFYYKNACDLIHEIERGAWIPDLIVFQYVFSDMKKHSSQTEIDDFIDTFSKYFNSKIQPGTYIILNDVNLGVNYGGGREYFDQLLDKLKDVCFYCGHFHNDNGRGYYENGYPYGVEFPTNKNRFDLSSLRNYSPFDTCASAQMIIKKVVNR